MPQEFEGDLADAEFWGADLSRATFRDVNLTGARISHAWVVDVEIDALVDRLVVNGVDVTAYVNDHDPWFPLRTMLRPDTPAEMLATWSTLEREWAATHRTVEGLAAGAAHTSVNGEWSYVQTLRHLVFAMDKWFTVPVADAGFDPIGLPNTGSLDLPWPGLDLSLDPPLDHVQAVRAERAQRFRSFLASLTADDLDRSIDVAENGPHPLRECIFTVFEEEFWHLRYARRDLLELPAA
ncbi:MAG: hypothetical protein RI958_435 [Actinomycetota bacterium]|jgi:hypothetical protein